MVLFFSHIRIVLLAAYLEGHENSIPASNKIQFLFMDRHPMILGHEELYKTKS